jgi:endonuclease YncB( thermonuclease family)
LTGDLSPLAKSDYAALMRVLLILIFLTGCGEGRLSDPVDVTSIRWSDGDSGEIDGDRFRLANVDAPEIGKPACEAERDLGRQTKRYVRQITENADVKIHHEFEPDRYDRGVLKSWPQDRGRALRAKPDWCRN